MKRWLWLALKIIGAIVGVLVLLVVALLVVMRPVKPLAVPAQGVTISGVTVINPGLDRRSNQAITVEGGSIKSIATAASGGDARYAGAYVLPGADRHARAQSAAAKP
jgi:hypothetical protein